MLQKKTITKGNLALLRQRIKNEMGEVTGISFNMLSAQEILESSVGEVTSTNLDSENPQANSLYDAAMGNLGSFKNSCETCGAKLKCPGHPMHMTLEVKVINPLVLKEIIQILKCSCPHCYRGLVDPERALCCGIKGKGMGRLQKIVQRVGKDKKCPHCFKGLPYYEQEKETMNIVYSYDEKKKKTKDDIKIKEEVEEEDDKDDKPKMLRLTADEIYKRFCKLPMDDFNEMGFNDQLPENPVFYNPSIQLRVKTKHRLAMRPEDLIVSVLPVVSSIIRPPDFEGKKDDLTDKYHNIVKHNIELREHRLGRKHLSISDKDKRETELAWNVITLIDNSSARATVAKEKEVRTLKGRVQGEVAKDSIFRAYIQGKRVDWSSRSVIGPGPDLDIDQLGVPQEAADILTRPYPVNTSNLEWAQKAVDEGRVNSIQSKGQKVIIRIGNRPAVKFKLTPRSDQYPGDIIDHRLINNDPSVFNRQPTLLVDSMMGFRIKISPGKTYKLPLAVTSSFNADFDGEFSQYCHQQGA